MWTRRGRGRSTLPSEAAHAGAAERHLRAAEDVRSRFPDWSAVMVLYAAVHRVEEACATHGHDNRDHQERNSYIRQHCIHVWPPYLRLLNESMKARYMDNGMFSLTAEQVRKQLIDGPYPKIEVAMRGYKKTPLIPPVPEGEGGPT